MAKVINLPAKPSLDDVVCWRFEVNSCYEERFYYAADTKVVLVFVKSIDSLSGAIEEARQFVLEKMAEHVHKVATHG